MTAGQQQKQQLAGSATYTADDLRYPIGRFTRPASLTAADRERAIEVIMNTPAQLRRAVEDLSPAQLDTPYRPEGWTVRQVVHHLPDSHMNSYVRFKLALTEDEPTIKPYDESRWAELPDAQRTPVETSLVLLAALHQRWVTLLRSMSEAQWARTMRHPETGVQRLDQVLALYAWHGPHHVAQITELRKRNGWR